MSIDASEILFSLAHMRKRWSFFCFGLVFVESKQEILSIEIWFTTYFSTYFFKHLCKRGTQGVIRGLSRHQHFLSTTYSFRVPGGIWHTLVEGVAVCLGGPRHPVTTGKRNSFHQW
jgi:hypothetical protein